MKNFEATRTRNRRVLFVETAKWNIDWAAERLFRHLQGYETEILIYSQITKDDIDWADSIFVLKIGQKRALGRIDSTAKHKTAVLGAF